MAAPTRYDLWCVNLNKAFARESVTEQTTDASLNAVDGLIGWSSQVKDTVVEASVLVDRGQILWSRKTVEFTRSKVD